MRYFAKINVVLLWLASVIVGIFFVTVKPAGAVAVHNSTLTATADVATIGTPRQVRVDSSDGKTYVLGGTTAMSIISVDGSSSTNVVYSTPLISGSFGDFVVSNGNVYISINAGISGPAYKYSVLGSVATLVASVGIGTGSVGDIAFGPGDSLYISKTTSVATLNTNLEKTVPTSTLLNGSAVRLTADGNGRVLYFTSTRRIYRSDLNGSDILISSALSSYAQNKGIVASADGSAVYFADGSGVIGKISVASGSILWTVNTGAATLLGMDVSTSTGRITTVNTSGVVNTYAPITPISNLSISPSSTSAVLSWDTGVTDSDYGGVTIRRSTIDYPASVTDGTSVTSSVLTSSFTDADLADGTYYYTLFNKTSDGYYSSGVTSTVSIDTTPPNAPTITAAAGAAAVTLNWDIPATTQSFTLKRSYNGSPYSIVSSTISTSVTSYVDTGLIDGSYTYAIYAQDISGNISSAGVTSEITIDTIAPAISAVAAVPSSVTAVINWETNENASSQIVYSPDTLYASSTALADTGDAATRNHEVIISRLLPCTEYNYKAVSADIFTNTSTSTAATFTTTGCVGGATISSSTSTLADTTLTSSASLTEGNIALSLSAPARFTQSHTQVTFQIKALGSAAVVASVGKPSSHLQSASRIVFDLKALADAQTTVETFDIPIDITFRYTTSEIVGLNESSLLIYHYHDGAWSALNNCTVDRNAKTITCATPSFSTFGLFGEAESGSGGVAYTTGGSIVTIFPPIPAPKKATLSSDTQQIPAAPEKNTTSIVIVEPNKSIFFACSLTGVLRLGSVGSAVKKLQLFLARQGSVVYPEALASGYFGPATRRAVIRFQEKYAADILQPWGLKQGTGIVSKKTLEKMCEVGN